MEEIVKRLQILLRPSKIREAMDAVKALETESPLLDVLISEVTRLHEALQHVSSSLTHLLSYLRGEEEFTASHGELLRLLANNKLSQKWAELIGLASGQGEAPNLATALKLVHSRIQFLTKCLTAPDCTIPTSLQVAWFAYPAAVPSALARAFALRHQLNTEQVSIRATVSILDRWYTNPLTLLFLPPSTQSFSVVLHQRKNSLSPSVTCISMGRTMTPTHTPSYDQLYLSMRENLSLSS